MYVQVVVAVEAYQVVLVSLVVAHEDVLAVHAAVILPPALSFLDGLALGMVVAGEGDIVLLQEIENFFFACHILENVRLPSALPAIIISRFVQKPQGRSTMRSPICANPSLPIHIQK